MPWRKGTGPVIADSLYRFVDRDGATLAFGRR